MSGSRDEPLRLGIGGLYFSVDERERERGLVVYNAYARTASVRQAFLALSLSLPSSVRPSPPLSPSLFLSLRGALEQTRRQTRTQTWMGTETDALSHAHGRACAGVSAATRRLSRRNLFHELAILSSTE
jgi:hypothetical protein